MKQCPFCTSELQDINEPYDEFDGFSHRTVTISQFMVDELDADYFCTGCSEWITENDIKEVNMLLEDQV